MFYRHRSAGAIVANSKYADFLKQKLKTFLHAQNAHYLDFPLVNLCSQKRLLLLLKLIFELHISCIGDVFCPPCQNFSVIGLVSRLISLLRGLLIRYGFGGGTKNFFPKQM